MKTNEASEASEWLIKYSEYKDKTTRDLRFNIDNAKTCLVNAATAFAEEQNITLEGGGVGDTS